MTFGNNAKGRHAPPPLPMYQPVVLKHVPTMLRRRYENFDAEKLQPNNTDQDEDLRTHDSESEGDVDEDQMDVCSPNDMDASEEDETQDNGHESLSNELGAVTEDNNEDIDQSGGEHPGCAEVTNADEEAHDNGYKSSGNEHDVGQCESEDNSVQNVHHSREVDALHVADYQWCSVIEGESSGEDISVQYVNRSGEVDAVHVADDHQCSVVEGQSDREDIGIQDANGSREVDDGVPDDCRQSDEEGSTDDEDNTGAWSEDVGNGRTQPTDSQTKDDNYEDDGILVASHACDLVSSLKQEALDKGLTDVGQCVSEDNSVQNAHLSREVDALHVADDQWCSVIEGQSSGEDISVQDVNCSGEVDSVHVADDYQCSVVEGQSNSEDISVKDANGSRQVDDGLPDDCRQSDKERFIDNEDNTAAWSEDVGNGGTQPTDSRTKDNNYEDEDILVASCACDLVSSLKQEALDKGLTGSDNDHDVGQCEREDNSVQNAYVSREVDPLRAADNQWCSVIDGQSSGEDITAQDVNLSQVDAVCVTDDRQFSVVEGQSDREDISVQDANGSCEVDDGVSDDCRQIDKKCFIDNEDKTGAQSEDVGNGSTQPTDSRTKDNKYEGDDILVVSRACNLDSSLKQEALDKGQTGSDNEQVECVGFQTGVSESKDSEDGHVKAAPGTSVKDESQDVRDGNSGNEQLNNICAGLPSEFSNRECDGAEDQNPDSSVGYSHTADEQKFIEDYGADNLLTRSLDLDLEREDGAEDRDLACDGAHNERILPCNVDDLAQVHNEQGFDMELEREDDGAGEMDLSCDGAHEKIPTCNVDAPVKVQVEDEAQYCSDNEQDFNPKATKNSQDEEDYELCCPICKQCITNTIIYQRRPEKVEDCRTTCFSWFIAQICCIGK